MLKYAVCSDIHLGHLKTPTQHIINSFKTSILNNNNKDIDILFISGDLFDRLLDLNSKEVHYIIEFFSYLLSYCQINNILLRVLEGTPSHDWQQSSILFKLNEIRSFKCDLKYHKVLDIEYIEQHNKYVLYVPDEWTNSHDELENQIQEKLNKHSITKVDIAILHGQFKYQLAGKTYGGFHYKEEYFLKLVTGYIHVGHYHVYSKFDRILVNGSLERLAHGEESPKGYIVVEDNNYSFVENTNSYTYVTLNITNTITLDKLDKLIARYPVNSFIRLLLNKEHEFNINFSAIKLRYLDYNLKKKIKELASEAGSLTYILTDDNDIEVSEVFILDTDIYNLLLNNIIAKHTLTDIENTKLLKYTEIFKQSEGDSINEYEK
jgi:DNA repair exonuclease SbcCD nuclease subunit